MSKTVNITSPSHFSEILRSSRVVVADFYADWCGPCKTIAPVYEQLSAQLSRPNRITFTKINTDTQKDIARTYDISAMPTFLIFKAGRETKRIRGADPKGLDAAVKQLAQEAQTGDEAGGEAGGEASGSRSTGARWTGMSAPRAYGEISDEVDIQGLDFLNLDGEAGNNRVIFTGGQPSAINNKATTGNKDWIESDTDEQLMLYIPFQSTVKLHSLHITSIPPTDDGEDEAPMRPKTIRLYINTSHVLGFDEAEDMKAIQEIELKESDWDTKTYTAKAELRFVKFQNISSLVVFVADGSGDGDKTRIDRLRLFGETGEKRAMGKLEKIGDEAGE